MRVNPSVGFAFFAILQRTERIKVKSLCLRGLEGLRDRERWTPMGREERSDKDRPLS
jgi:hypothetical protein